MIVTLSFWVPQEMKVQRKTDNNVDFTVSIHGAETVVLLKKEKEKSGRQEERG